MRIVCQQTILMKYHALFVILKKRQNSELSSAAIIGGALGVNLFAIDKQGVFGTVLTDLYGNMQSLVDRHARSDDYLYAITGITFFFIYF